MRNLTLRWLFFAGSFALRQCGQRLGQALLQLVEPLDCLLVGVGRLAVGHIGRDNQPDLLAHVVEGQHLVEEEQAGIGNAEFVLGQIGQPLDLAHGVVGKIANRAGRERGQAGEPRGLVARKRPAQHGKHVVFKAGDFSALGNGDIAATRHNPLEGRQADEGVAADLLAALY